MKILLYTSVLSGGGAERVLCQLANGFLEDNEVVLVASYESENEYLVNKKVKKIYLCKHNSDGFIKQVRALRGVLKDEKPDMCISFLPAPNIKLLLANIGLNLKTIISVRNDPSKEYSSIVFRLAAKYIYPFADGVVFQTKQAKDWFPQKIQNKSEIIMNQVNSVFFNRKKIGSDYWVATGRLNVQKNYPLMIDAFRKVVDQKRDAKLRIYGTGELCDNINCLIRNYGLEDNIKLMGKTDDIPQVLENAKGFILSSDFEGMPNGLLEAFAMGVPCISTDCPCGGPAMIISDGINGYLVPVKDADGLYRKIMLIESDEERARAISEQAKKDALAYHPDKIIEQWLEYVRLVKERL